MNKQSIDKDFASVKGKVFLNKPLSELTTFKIGGPAMMVVEPLDAEDLKNILFLCKKHRVSFFVLGAGSNVLVDDKPIDKIIIRMISPLFKEIEYCGDKIVCGSGVNLGSLINASTQKGLGGLEFLSGVPGTVGGAVMMNAGSAENAIGNFTEWVKLIDYDGKFSEIKKPDLSFDYRKSGICDKIVLSACFSLERCEPEVVRKKVKESLAKKTETQDIKFPSAGCIFRNPAGSGRSAGTLIELAGLKGKKIGHAQFSELHANYIINLGGAGFSDVKALMDMAQEKVKEKFNICLEQEIKILT